MLAGMKRHHITPGPLAVLATALGLPADTARDARIAAWLAGDGRNAQGAHQAEPDRGSALHRAAPGGCARQAGTAETDPRPTRETRQAGATGAAHGPHGQRQETKDEKAGASAAHPAGQSWPGVNAATDAPSPRVVRLAGGVHGGERPGGTRGGWE